MAGLLKRLAVQRIFSGQSLGRFWKSLALGTKESRHQVQAAQVNHYDLTSDPDFYRDIIAPIAGVTFRELDPWLTAAAEHVQPKADQPLTVCNYGGGDGLASVRAMDNILDITRRRFGSGQPVLILYEDQADDGDDTAAFLDTLGLLEDSDPAWFKSDPNVFVTVCGTGLDSQCLPDDTVNIGIARLSQDTSSPVSCLELGSCSTDELSIWTDVTQNGLLHRAKEIASGGYLAVAATMGGVHASQHHLLQHAIQTMLHDNIITQEEAEDLHASIPTHFQSEEEAQEQFLKPDSPVRATGLELIDIKTKTFDCVLRMAHPELLQDEQQKYIAPLLTTVYRRANNHLLSTLLGHRPTEEAMALEEECFQRMEDAIAIDPDSYRMENTVFYALMWKK